MVRKVAESQCDGSRCCAGLGDGEDTRLERFRSQTVYAVLGMMAGSLYSIAQGPLTLAVPQPAMELATFSPLYFVAGGLVVGGLQLMRRRLEDPADAAGAAPETKSPACEPNRQPDLP